MYTLYALQEKLHSRASELLKLDEWVRQRFGFDGWWACFCFDSAVTRFGSWVDGQLMETDEQGRPRYTLSAVLDPTFVPGKGRKLTPEETARTLEQFFG